MSIPVKGTGTSWWQIVSQMKKEANRDALFHTQKNRARTNRERKWKISGGERNCEKECYWFTSLYQYIISIRLFMVARQFGILVKPLNFVTRENNCLDNCRAVNPSLSSIPAPRSNHVKSPLLRNRCYYVFTRKWRINKYRTSRTPWKTSPWHLAIPRIPEDKNRSTKG